MGNPSQPPHDEPGQEPGDDPWLRAVRELAANPDSPSSLRIISAVNAALRPSRAAVDQLVLALAEQLERPGSAADVGVDAAVQHWQSVCRVAVTPEMLQAWREEAADLIERRRRRPPPVESVVSGVEARPDAGYDLAVHMEGLRGTWHRLWASIGLARAFGDSPEQRAYVATVRAQFEQLLGRALSPQEWAQLEQHAHRHGEAMAARMRRDPDGAGDAR